LRATALLRQSCAGPRARCFQDRGRERVTRSGFAVDVDAERRLTQRSEHRKICHTADFAHRGFDLLRSFRQHDDVVADELDRVLAFDPGYSLLDIVLDVLREVKVEARKFCRQVIGSRRALALTTNPGRFLSTVQVGITLVGVLSGAFSGATLGLRLAEWFVDCGHYLLLVGDWRASAEADCAARSGKNRGPGGACHDGHGDDCVAHRLVPGFFWARGFKRAGISGPARAPGHG